MILSASKVILLISQLSMQLMVRKLDAPLIFCNNYELKFDIADTNVESLEPIQPDAIGASLVFPPFQIEATVEKVLHPLCHPFVIN